MKNVCQYKRCGLQYNKVHGKHGKPAILENWTNPEQVSYMPCKSLFILQVSWYLYYQFGKTWEKLQMAARVIVIARYTGVNAIAGLHIPDTFTNQLQTSFSEPRLLILTDPRIDHYVS
ncbi:hypothetical protein DCAR_0521293 [Daucus carota subsp. sativus]|uniref:Uncharacterized protein n=1 Tax=Daucus carota subsp. sativus TaxID=79200 RepID=A0AAF0X7H8_DAUCS|nr:hypothetical protein DCAR_0521293 [Daucus carota subsp. sativus]